MRSSFLFLALIVLSFTHHPYHVGLCEINFNATRNSIEVSQKVFLDDFDRLMDKKGLTFKMGGNKTAKIDSFIEQYWSLNFELSTSNHTFSRQFIGYEIEQESLWFYWEYVLQQGELSKVQEIWVKNTGLFDLEEDQSHLIHLLAHQKKQSGVLSKEKHLLLFSYNP